MESPPLVLFGPDSTDPDHDGDAPFAGLPPELVELIIGFMWRLEDQLLCRQVCKWWRQRVGFPVRYDPDNRPIRRYSFTQSVWTTLSSQGRTLRTMRFDRFGCTHLWEYSPDGHRIVREVIFQPPNRVTEIRRDHQSHRRVLTHWHLPTHTTRTEIKYDGAFCAIL